MGTYRLDYAFRGGDLSLTGLADSQQKAPAADPIVPAGTGFWLTVHDSKGRPTHAQILRDPRTGDAAATAVPDQVSWAFIPDPGANGHVAFHMAFPSPDQPTASARMAVFPLKGSGALSVFSQLQKVFRSPRPPVWLLIVGDGFGPGELPLFESFADDLADRLCALEPFNDFPELRSRIFRRAGPTTPGGGFGWDIDGLEGRLLMKVDSGKAMKFVAKQLKLDPVNVLVVINDQRYGGSGGDPGVTGLGAPGAVSGNRDNAIDAAIHELGHSAFALADEYDLAYPGASTTPLELNVAHDAVSVRSKWGDLLHPKDVALPTLEGATSETVGMFKGAKYDAENNYRSQLDCRMRTVNRPFCAACRQVISSVLACEI